MRNTRFFAIPFLCLFLVSLVHAEVLLGTNATPVQRRAARELENYLGKILGTEVSYPRVLLGNDFAEAAGIDLNGLGDEGFVICLRNGALHISAGTPNGRGILYGIYEFLERQGCRFWTETEEDIPRRGTLWLPDQEDIRQTPVFPLFRWIISGTCSQEWIMSGKLKLNGGSFNFEPIPEDGTAAYEAPHNSHTHFKFLPAKLYGAEHPEYYALQKDGSRLADDARGQLCLTNPQMVAEYIKNVRGYLKEKYKEGMILVISQSDNYNHCQCAACLASNRHYDSPSGTFLAFLNQIALAVEKDYPKLRIRTSAYQYTRKPPKGILPARNVVVGLSNIECDFSRGFTDDSPPENRQFLEYEEVWSKIAHTLFIGNYGTSFDAYLFPFPNFDSMASRYQMAVRHGAKGASMLTAHANAFGEFGHLRDYLTARLLWNPQQDPWEIAREFCGGYYGKKAGDILWEYLRFYHRYFAEKKVKFRFALYDRTYYSSCLEPEIVTKARMYYDQALLAAADSPTFLRRVREAELSIRFMELSAHLDWLPDSAKWRHFFEEFVRDAKAANCLALGEEKKNLLTEWATRIRNLKVPEDLSSIRKDSTAECVNVPLSLMGRGKWTMEEKDALASNGKAAKLLTNHAQWAIQAKMTLLARYGKGPWALYARVRVKARADLPLTAGLFQAGCQNGLNVPPQFIQRQNIPDDKYTWVKVAGPLTPTETAYVWFAPLNNPDDMEAVFVDLVVAIQAVQ